LCQDELDGYDKARVAVEEKLDEKTAELIHLQRVTLEQAHASPVRAPLSDQCALAFGIVVRSGWFLNARWIGCARDR
jgi:hypothetical protein